MNLTEIYQKKKNIKYFIKEMKKIKIILLIITLMIIP